MVSTVANPYVVTDERVHTLLPPASLEKLDRAFLDNISTPKQNTSLLPYEIAWCNCVYALISYGGIAGPKCLTEIVNLRFNDLTTCTCGYIHIPRAGGHVPVFVPEIVSLCIQSLVIHLRRGRGAGCNRLGKFPPDGYIIPSRDNPSAALGDDEWQKWEERFQGWLKCLGEQAKIPISISRLVQLSRARLARCYTPAVAGAVLGLHLYDPAPVEQRAHFQDFKQDLANDVFQAHEIEKVYLPRFRAANQMAAESKSMPQPVKLPEIFRRLRNIVAAYSRLEKQEARNVRGHVRRKLDEFCVRLEASIGKPPEISWLDWFTKCREQPTLQDDEMMALWIARWLYGMLRKSPHSVDARMNDVLGLVSRIRGLSIWDVDENRLNDIFDRAELSSASRSRKADSLLGFFLFVKLRYGIGMPSIAWRSLDGSREIHEQRILTQTDIEALLPRLNVNRHLDRQLAVAILLGYYFGLRDSEICNLQIGDIWLDGTPTVFIWKSKRGRSRFVQGVKVPTHVIDFLKGFQKDRKVGVDNNPSDPFLVTSAGKAFKRQRLSRRLRRLMEMTGIEVSSGAKRSVSHALRHACANRWWVLGLPLVEITRRLGHQSAQTTVQEYMHAFHFSQAEQVLNFPPAENITFTNKGLAMLIGTTPRNLRYLVSREMLQKPQYPYTLKSVNLLLSKLTATTNN